MPSHITTTRKDETLKATGTKLYWVAQCTCGWRVERLYESDAKLYARGHVRWMKHREANNAL